MKKDKTKKIKDTDPEAAPAKDNTDDTAGADDSGKKNSKKNKRADSADSAAKQTGAGRGGIIVKKPKKAVIALIALFAFLLTFAAQSLFSNVFSLSTGTEITAWKFVWASDNTAIEQNITQYNQETSENRIKKAFGKNWLRLNYTFSSSDKDTQLCIKTFYNPIRIDLNGKTVLDNNYHTASFTGQCSNYVTIPSSGSEQTVNVYIYCPLAYSVSSYTSTPSYYLGAGSLSENIGLILGAAVALAGIILMITSFLMGARSHSMLRLLLLGMTVVLCGVFGFARAFAGHSASITSPYLFSGTNAINMILVLFLYLNFVVGYTERKNKGDIFFIIAMFVLSAASVFVPNVLVYRIEMAAFAALQFFFFIRLFNTFFDISEARPLPGNDFMRVLLAYTGILGIYNSAASAVGISQAGIAAMIIGSVFVCLSMYVLICTQSVFTDIKSKERSLIINEDTEWIKKTTLFLSSLFTQTDEKGFFTEGTKSFARLIKDVLHDEYNTDEDEISMNISAAVFDDGKYAEIYSSGDVHDCNYETIEESLLSRGDNLFVGSTQAEILFTSESHPNAIIYIGNIKYGLGGRLNNILRMAYTGMETAYSNLSLKNDILTMQESLFVNVAKVVEGKDDSTGRHMLTVSKLVETLCRELNMPEDKIKIVSAASMVHDIGKIAIPESILDKKGQLTPEERQTMEKHVHYGYNILSQQDGEFFDAAAKIALQHHENYDGTGYLGFRGENIDFNARIVRVADVFDALASKRSYKEQWEFPDIIEYITSGAGTLFDPSVVGAFSKCSDKLVMIKNSREGTVE